MKLKKIFVLTSLALTSISSMAATASATFQVTAIVNASCYLSATNIAFGTVTPAISGNRDATGTITAQCTKTTPYILTISSGNSGDFNNRVMKNTFNEDLMYNIFLNSSRTTIWGDSGVNRLNQTGNGLEQNYTTYGRMPLNQFIRPGNYTDNLTVTLTY